MDVKVKFHGIPAFRPRHHKLVAAILFLMEEAARRGRSLSRGMVVKAVFLADDRHLQEHGRPITFDNYVAMPKGPVGDCAIDMLNGRFAWETVGRDGPPWTEATVAGKPVYAATEEADRRRLSPSDEELLHAALAEVLGSGFDRVSEESHEHPAWVAAWAGRGRRKAAPMDWRLFGHATADHIDDLVIASGNLG